VVFSSKHAGKVDRFLDRHQVVIVSATKFNSARSQFPVVMPFVFPLVKYLYGLIPANRGEREQKQLSSISLARGSFYRYTNRCPIRDFFGQGRGGGRLTYSRCSLQLKKAASVLVE
jgi:hypothetical protein